jgi:uracil-DNA glycosylase family 4
MSSESQSPALVELVQETKKHLKYLQELGVEGIRRSERASTAKPDHIAPLKASLSLATTAHLPDGLSAGVDEQRPAAQTLTTLFGDLGPRPERLAQSTETFADVWSEIGDCTRCPLHQGRTHVVHTEGNRKARLMFVGEAPGADEDEQARPFVGRAGQLLTKIIEAIGLKREEVLIGNVNRCRPPANRPPTPEEASMCKPFLLREIAIVQPDVIVVMGNTAMRNLLDTKDGITKLRGKFQDYQGIKVMPTFHPAYLLRDPSKKRETWEDLKKVRDYLDTTGNIQ